MTWGSAPRVKRWIDLRRGCEAGERVAVEGVGLPGGVVPSAVLVADYLHGHDDAIAAQLVGGGDAVFEFAVGAHGEFYGARQVIVPEQLELVLARIRAEHVWWSKHAGLFPCLVHAFHVGEIADDARPFRFLRHRVFDVMRRVVLDLGFTTGLADFVTLESFPAHFLALVKQVWLKIGRLAAHPEGDIEPRQVPAARVIGGEKDVTDGQVPIIVNEVDEFVDCLGAGFVGVGLRCFHSAGEERRVGAGQLVPQLDGKVHRAGVGAALVFGNVVAAAFRLQPTALLRLFGVAVKLYPGPGGRLREVNVELAAAGDGTIDAIRDLGHPAPVVVVFFVDVECVSGDLDRVFGDGGLIFLGGGFAGQKKHHDQRQESNNVDLVSQINTSRGHPMIFFGRLSLHPQLRIS